MALALVILYAVNETRHSAPELTAITVSQLNRRAKTLLEQGIARLWVEGEISNLARPASGHLYFSLKDESAQIRAAFFRQRQRGPTIGFKNGDKIIAFGRVSLYEARGDYQLIVEQVEAAGEGALQREFDKLKKKLAAEGLFDADRKQPLPALPERIGIITSASGAAVRDVLTVLKRRFPAIPVTIYPSAVQGDAAPVELLAALQAAVRRDECDVLLLCRGGGSLEDLWAFNNETLARSIADCPIPIVSAVGHEVDFTIADFVADVRAPTPSGGAELVVPDHRDWLRMLNSLALRVARLGRRSLEDQAQTLDWLKMRLLAGSPAANVIRQGDRLRGLRARLLSTNRRTLTVASHRLHGLYAQIVNAEQRVLTAIEHRLQLAIRGLHSVSPLATLDRGYAIVMDHKTGRALTDTTGMEPGQQVQAKLHRGEFTATVTAVSDNEH